MTDYNTLMKRQYGYVKKDGYPNILGEKMAKKSTKEIEDEAPTQDVYPEGDELAEQEAQDDEQTEVGHVNELASWYQDGLQTIQTVMQTMPQCAQKNNAILFLDSHVLWMEQLFTVVRQNAERKDAMRAKMKKKGTY